MAEQDKKVSDLTTVTDVSASGLAMTVIPDPNDPTKYLSRKITNGDLAESFLNDFEFPLLLNTTSKKIIGAINELQSSTGGATVLTGTTAPTSDQGEDGSLYVQYTEGTGGAPDVVNALFVKLDGEWVSIDVGGGGTTPTVLTDTLTAGSTSLAFSNAAITTNSKFEILTSDLTVRPTAANVSTGTITLTFESQASDLTVQLEVT